MRETVDGYHDMQRGVLKFAEGLTNIGKRIAPGGTFKYAVNMAGTENFRKLVAEEIERAKDANILSYGNVLLFDEDNRLVFHNGRLPDEYLGITAREIFDKRDPNGRGGFEKVVERIENKKAGEAEFRWSDGKDVKIVAWQPIVIDKNITYIMLLYADRGDVFGELRFYYRTWLTIIGTFLFNVIIGIVGILYVTKMVKIAIEEERVKHRVIVGRLEERFKLIYDTACDSIAVFDIEGNVLDVNRSGLDILGMEKDEVTGRHYSEFLVEDNLQADIEAFTGMVEKNENAFCETSLKCSGGRKVPVSIHAIVFEHGGEKLVQAILRDITENRVREDQRISTIKLNTEIEHLRKLNSLKTNFLSMVSHELRTPLAVIIGNVELMSIRKEYPEDSKQAKRITTVLRRGYELKKLIDDLLSMASIEAGRLELHPVQFEIIELLNDIESINEDTLTEKSISFDSKCSTATMVVVADKNKLQQVINNLVSNSIKFTPEKGKISIFARDTGEEIMFTITDNGPGIPREAIGNVFDRFFQVDNSMTRLKGGSGIGLSIAKDIVELHGGWIKVENIDPCGLKVVFSIKKNVGFSESLSEKVQHGSDCKNVLLVDDDRERWKKLSDVLSRNNFSVGNISDFFIRSDDGENGTPDIIIIDGSTKKDEKARLCRTFKMDAETKDIPILMIIDQETGIKSAREAGASDYIISPFEYKDLVIRLDKMIFKAEP